ncbi:MAG: hypothetical protein V1856_01390, partial [Candidatus Liptonbacteria bacterium]
MKHETPDGILGITNVLDLLRAKVSFIAIPKGIRLTNPGRVSNHEVLSFRRDRDEMIIPHDLKPDRDSL